MKMFTWELDNNPDVFNMSYSSMHFFTQKVLLLFINPICAALNNILHMPDPLDFGLVVLTEY